jgi:long-chain acyl-CoA synthetase
MQQAELLTLRNVLAYSLDNYRDNIAFSFTDDTPVHYSDLKRSVEDLQLFLLSNGISKGDRIAILSQNMPNWGIAYFAITTLGAVAVPLLPDFSAGEITNILAHSGTKALFVSQRLVSKIEPEGAKPLKLQVLIDDFSVIPFEKISSDITKLKGTQAHFTLPSIEEDDLASIIYTSGTTGRSKGVMLTHKNLVFDARQVMTIQPVNSADIFLSVLPLSHTYENTLGLILPVMQGASVYYLKKPPTASVLLPALSLVRPTVMLTVPMIIEKIFKAQVLGKFSGNFFKRSIYKFTPFRKIIHRIAGKKLSKAFGGRLHFYGIGGAKIDPITEKFLREAHFPYGIGYGLTETSPLLAGSNPCQTKWQAVGPVMQGVELRIDNPDPKTGNGEILAKGDNIMKGYYHDKEMTDEVISPDGWFRTGDLGCIDKSGYLFIKGRLKNMILTASGENIYPEDIESLINNFNYVVESIVIEKKGKLIALVHFDHEALQKQFENMKEEARTYILDHLNFLQDELIAYVNERVNKCSRLQAIELMPTPFEKTPTLKIKRYLYC